MPNRFQSVVINTVSGKKHSTPLALTIDLYEKNSTAFDRGEFAVGIFLDLSKAFDTVNRHSF